MSPVNQLNDLDPKTWAQYSASVLTGFTTLEEIIKRLIKIYSKEKNKIISSSNIWDSLQRICNRTKRELLNRQIESIQEELGDLAVGESLSFKPTNFETYQSLCHEIGEWMSHIARLLRPGHYLIWLVKDFRVNDYFIPFHKDIAHIGIEQGLIYHDLWIWDKLEQKKDHHSNSHIFIVVLRKLSPATTSTNEDMVRSLYVHGKNRKTIFSQKKKRLNFIPEYSKTVIRDFSSPRRGEYLEHGATFPQPLIEYLINIFTHSEETILDIFVGTGIALQASEKLARNSIGIELNPKYYSIARKLLGLDLKALEINTNVTIERPFRPKLIHDDCRNLKRYVRANSVDLMVTSPPYANILHKVAKEAKNRGEGSVFRRRRQQDKEKTVTDLRTFLKTDEEENIETSQVSLANRESAIPHPYSGDEKDLGNIHDYNTFLDEIGELHRKIFDVLKPGRFAIWIVRDFRDVAHGRYFIPFHCDLAEKAQDMGFEYYDLWVWDQTKERRIIHLGGGTAYYNSLTHSMIVILRKPTK
ncbi:MAG: DNA methyltransferase [Candidatus Hermodarchaeota archaeon]